MLKKILLLFVLVCTVSLVFPQDKIIAIFGSSVAKGSGDSTGNGGYTGMLRDTLQRRGWKVVNVSKGGDNTLKIMPRFATDLLPVKAKYVIIALSLGNEGIATENELTRNRIFEQYRSKLFQIVRMCREAGMIPVVVNCYTRADFEEEQYDAIKKMNLIINTWDVPSFNVLGVIDNGKGNWADGYMKDKSHPNLAGHREFYFACVPSLFDALESGKPLPVRSNEKSYLQIMAKGMDKPLSYIPARDSIHSFAVSFRVMTESNGTIACIRSGGNNACISFNNGKLVYNSTNQTLLSADTISENKSWQYLVLTHSYVRHETFFYVNGKLAGSVKENLRPEEFIIGGGGKADFAPPIRANYKDLMIYRSSLNQDEVTALYYNQLLQSSLEIYAPLNDLSFIKGQNTTNYAQSMSELKIGEGVFINKQ
jgi:lysophospholipase L1-like esterase